MTVCICRYIHTTALCYWPNSTGRHTLRAHLELKIVRTETSKKAYPHSYTQFTQETQNITHERHLRLFNNCSTAKTVEGKDDCEWGIWGMQKEVAMVNFMVSGICWRNEGKSKKDTAWNTQTPVYGYRDHTRRIKRIVFGFGPFLAWST